MSWQRNATGSTTLANSNGKILLDSVDASTFVFGLWVIICDSVLDDERRDFSILSTTLFDSDSTPELKYNRFAYLSTGAPIPIHFDILQENGLLAIYGTSIETVNYNIYRFWSNQSYTDPILTEGIFGTSSTTPQVFIDSFGRLVDIKEVIITPEWRNVIGKPTTVALSGLVDALSTSSTLDCGAY